MQASRRRAAIPMHKRRGTNQINPAILVASLQQSIFEHCVNRALTLTSSHSPLPLAKA